MSACHSSNSLDGDSICATGVRNLLSIKRVVVAAVLKLVVDPLAYSDPPIRCDSYVATIEQRVKVRSQK